MYLCVRIQTDNGKGGCILKLFFSSGKLRLGRYLRNWGSLVRATVCAKAFITYITVTVKCKVRPWKCHESPEGKYKYNCTFF